jgi:hypothetical protein
LRHDISRKKNFPNRSLTPSPLGCGPASAGLRPSSGACAPAGLKSVVQETDVAMTAIHAAAVAVVRAGQLRCAGFANTCSEAYEVCYDDEYCGLLACWRCVDGPAGFIPLLRRVHLPTYVKLLHEGPNSDGPEDTLLLHRRSMVLCQGRHLGPRAKPQRGRLGEC